MLSNLRLDQNRELIVVEFSICLFQSYAYQDVDAYPRVYYITPPRFNMLISHLIHRLH